MKKAYEPDQLIGFCFSKIDFTECNLKTRSDLQAGITQNFCYDTLNRLVASRFGSCTSSMTDYTYDLLGNLTKKTEDGVSMTLGYSGQGQYTNNAGPHAVTAANGWGYVYDKTGNLTSATKTGQSTKTVQYSPFNTPTQITWGSKTSTLVYGPNQDRIKHSDSNGRVTTYIGGVYEEVTKGGVTYYIHSVGDIGQMVSTGAHTTATVNYEYTHRDQLGSIVAVTGKTLSSAADIKRQSNGAWGERRYQQWNGPQDNALIPQTSARGFTDHEHMDAVGLIHMNGRVYDPELGRFLSADPIIQSPYNTQSYNRYSYVFNNPLSFTDPSGFTAAGYQSYGGFNQGGSGYQDYGYGFNQYDFNGPVDSARPTVKIYADGYVECPGSLCLTGIPAWNYAKELQNWTERQQSAMVNVGGFWGGVGYVGVAVIHEVLLQEVVSAVDSTGNGHYGDALISVAMAAFKPLKAADKVNDSLNKTDALKIIPGRVQSRINLSNKGISHVLSRHLNPEKAGNKSQFTMSETELRSLLGAKSTVQSPATALDSGNFARTINLDRSVGNLAEKMGGGSTNTFTVITDKFGNLETAFPGGL